MVAPVSLELQPRRQRVDDVPLRDRAPDVVEMRLRLQARDEPREALAQERIQRAQVALPGRFERLPYEAPRVERERQRRDASHDVEQPHRQAAVRPGVRVREGRRRHGRDCTLGEISGGWPSR
jgi:hypothetical protein